MKRNLTLHSEMICVLIQVSLVKKKLDFACYSGFVSKEKNGQEASLLFMASGYLQFFVNP